MVDTVYPTVIAVVVTYHPTEDVSPRLQALSEQVSQVLVLDNTPAEQQPEKILSQLQQSNIQIMYHGENLGLAVAQNRGIQKALNDYKADYVLLMDDDSTPASNMVAALLAEAEKHPDAGILAPVIKDGRKPHYVPVPKGKYSFCRKPSPAAGSVVSALLVIASGSLIPARVLRDVGLMPEVFFIDALDWDFCARVQQAGYGITVVGDAQMQHRIGETKPHRIFGRVVYSNHHQPARRYLAARNRVMFWRMYLQAVPALVLYTLLASLREVVVMLLCEKNRRKKFSAMARGWCQGLRQNLASSA